MSSDNMSVSSGSRNGGSTRRKPFRPAPTQHVKPYLHHPMANLACYAVDLFQIIKPDGTLGDVYLCNACVKGYMTMRWYRRFHYVGACDYNEIGMDSTSCTKCKKLCIIMMNEKLINSGLFTGNFTRTPAKL